MKRATLTLDVYFDESLTSSVNVAAVLDQLLETAMSTPGILEEHGEVQVEEICILNEDE